MPIFDWDFPWKNHPLKVTVAELRQLDSVKALLDLGADVNRPSKTGRSNLREELMMGLAFFKTPLFCC